MIGAATRAAGVNGAKYAVTVRSADMVSVSVVLDPEAALQPMSAAPALGVAVMVTTSPGAYPFVLHVAGGAASAPASAGIAIIVST